MPPGGTLPPAETEDGIEVAEPIERLVAAMAPRTRLGVRLALRAFQWTPFPRRFSSLGPERRARHIERMEDSGLALRRNLAMLPKTLAAVGYARDPRVQRALGAEPGCALADPRTRIPAPAQPLDPAAMVAPEPFEHCDVVVVGSGAGGAVTARVLAEAGLDVIVVEQGEHFDASSYPSDPIDALPLLYRDAGLTICEGTPAIPVPVGRCVGGTTVVNSGTCLRTPDAVLANWRDEHGIAWATELEEDFEDVERSLNLTPVDLATAGRNAQLCHAGAEAIGASNGPIMRNAPSLRLCGTCATGCRIDAKQAMHVSELPRAVAAGARIRAGAEVREIVIRRGRAAGVECRIAGSGARYTVRADRVVLAAGAFGTPELLLRQGLRHRELGRHLRIHPACWVGALYGEDVRGWDGVMQSWFVDEWQGRGLFLEATFAPLAFGAHWLRGAGEEYRRRLESYGRLAVIGVHLSERSEGRVRLRGGSLRLHYSLTRDDAATIRYGIARAADIHFAAGAREVYPQIAGVPVIRSGEQKALVEDGRAGPAELWLEGFHPMGSARMGPDASSSVVSPSGESHDLPGLFIADTSLFPTSLRVNPMVTAMACARRVANGIAESMP